MSIFRSDQQIALNNLLAATKATADHYRDAAEMIEDPAVKEDLLQISTERERIIAQLEGAVRRLNELPSTPHADKEYVEKVVHPVRAALSADKLKEVLQQRLDDEQGLLDLINQVHQARLPEACDPPVRDLEAHANSVLRRLREWVHAA